MLSLVFLFFPHPVLHQVLCCLEKKKERKKKGGMQTTYGREAKRRLQDNEVCKQVARLPPAATLVSQATPALARGAFKITLTKASSAE